MHTDIYCRSAYAQPLVTPGRTSLSNLTMCLISKYHSKPTGLPNKGTFENFTQKLAIACEEPLSDCFKEILAILGIQQ